MARTGLRMMPTSPSPSLKSVRRVFPSTASRPAIRFDLSTHAVRNRERQLPACPHTHDPFVSTLRTSPPSEEDQALSPGRSRASACRCTRGSASLPQGSLAPARVLLSRTLIAYSDPIRQSHRHAAPSRPRRLYATPSLCGSASATRGTFPTFLPCSPGVPSTIRRWVQGAVPLPVRTSIPGFLALSPSRHPQEPASASNIRRGTLFDAASFASCCGPSVCQDLLTGSDPMASRARHPAFCGPLSFPLFARPVAVSRWESG